MVFGSSLEDIKNLPGCVIQGITAGKWIIVNENYIQSAWFAPFAILSLVVIHPLQEEEPDQYKACYECQENRPVFQHVLGSEGISAVLQL